MHAVVTGGAQGIGLACAQHLTSIGWTITLIDKDLELLSSQVPIRCSITSGCNHLDQSRLLSEINLYSLINNAGIWRPLSGIWTR